MVNKRTKKSDVLYHIIKRWRILILFVLFGLLVGGALNGISYIRGEIQREYRITSSFTVLAKNKNEKFASDRNNPELGDNDYATDIADSAVYLVKSRSNLKNAVELSGVENVSAGDISSHLTVEKKDGTNIIETTLLWRSEAEGLEIMNAINKASETIMLNTMEIGTVAVIDEPRASHIIGGGTNLSTWVFIGFMVGLMYCILKWIFDTTVINELDIEDIYEMDSLGSVRFDPKYAFSKPMKDVPVMDDIKSVTHLIVNRMEVNGFHKLYLTSTKHYEGKTRLAADIAIHLSDLGKRTLLIDCDFSNPVLGTLFLDELPYEHTLNALYRGDCDRLDAITHINGCLDILPLILKNHPETVNDELLAEIDSVTGGYDYVIIDAAPVGEDAEVLRLNEIVDTAVFVIRFDYAKVDAVRRAMFRMQKSGLPILGGVFNCVVNWKQTITNSPKRFTKTIKKEIKKKNKHVNKHAKGKGKKTT